MSSAAEGDEILLLAENPVSKISRIFSFLRSTGGVLLKARLGESRGVHEKLQIDHQSIRDQKSCLASPASRRPRR